MFTFKSPVTSKNVWKLCFRDRAEMNKIYEALPTVEYGYLFCDQLGNPGIAEQKGWQVTW